MCSGFTPVPVSPSPKSHAYDSTSPSGSDEADPSNVHSYASHWWLKAAVGSWFPAPPAPRLRMIVHMEARLAASVVAVLPP